MLAKEKARREGAAVARVDITSLIDIVFLLLIFLMVVTITAFNEVKAELNLPAAHYANPEKRQEMDRLIVNIDRDGLIYVMNVRMSMSDLRRLLAEVARNSIGPDGFSERPVYIRADENRPFGEVQDVMDACRAVRIWKLALRTISPSDQEASR